MECIGLTASVTEVAVDVQRLLLGPGRGRVITGQPPYDPEVVECVGLAEKVVEVTVDTQCLLEGLGRGRVIACEPPNIPEVVEGVGTTEPVAEMQRCLDGGGGPRDGVGPGAIPTQPAGDAGGECRDRGGR